MEQDQMLNIYKYIADLQERIGNGVEIKLSVRDGGLVIHAYYYKEDFNVQLMFSPAEMERVELCPTAFFADHCKCEFDWRLRRRT